jgi:TPR repeat protein
MRNWRRVVIHRRSSAWLCFTKEAWGVKQDYVEAMRLYRLAAEQNLGEADTGIGWLYSHGYGVKQGYDQARTWHLRADEHGDDDGANNLGDMYFEGLGTKKDYVEARKWWTKAAERGSGAAKFNIANLYDAHRRAAAWKAEHPRPDQQ